MYKIMYAYSGGNWETYATNSKITMDEFIESLRPAEKRPSHIILDGFTEEERNVIQTEKIWTPTYLWIEDGYMKGYQGFTAKKLAKYFGYKYEEK